MWSQTRENSERERERESSTRTRNRNQIEIEWIKNEKTTTSRLWYDLCAWAVKWTLPGIMCAPSALHMKNTTDRYVPSGKWINKRKKQEKNNQNHANQFVCGVFLSMWWVGLVIFSHCSILYDGCDGIHCCALYTGNGAIKHLSHKNAWALSTKCTEYGIGDALSISHLRDFYNVCPSGSDSP